MTTLHKAQECWDKRNESINRLEIDNMRLRKELAATEQARSLLEKTNALLLGDFNSEMYLRIEAAELQISKLKIKCTTQEAILHEYAAKDTYQSTEIKLLYLAIENNPAQYDRQVSCKPVNNDVASSASDIDAKQVYTHQERVISQFKEFCEIAKHYPRNIYCRPDHVSTRPELLRPSTFRKSNRPDPVILEPRTDSEQPSKLLTVTANEIIKTDDNCKCPDITRNQLESQNENLLLMHWEDMLSLRIRYNASLKRSQELIVCYQGTIKELHFQNTNVQAARNHWQQKAMSISKDLKYRLALIIPLQYELRRKVILLEEVRGA